MISTIATAVAAGIAAVSGLVKLIQDTRRRRLENEKLRKDVERGKHAGAKNPKAP